MMTTASLTNNFMNTLNLIALKDEINKQIADKEVFGALLTTTFKGLEAQVAKRAMLEGVMRGFSLKDFLEKNIYAIPFRDGYTLVNSIDYARKTGMRSGVVGVSAPTYTYEEVDGKKKVESCTITVKRKIESYIGEYTATVFFDEYYKEGKTWSGKYTPSMWDNKPRTMIAKVAEMHALRKACPEELAQVYVEEDFQKEDAIVEGTLDETYKNEIDAIVSLEKLTEYYAANKGKGKEFDKYVTKRKSELEAA